MNNDAGHDGHKEDGQGGDARNDGVQDDDLLTVATVGAHLVGRGLAGRDDEVRATELGGGVSNVVLSCTTGSRRLVVKQSLARLRVSGTWLAPRERILTEARALELTGRLTPGRVPAVLDVDTEACAIVLEHAPDPAEDWRTALLGGRAEVRVAVGVGAAVGRWHAETIRPGPVADTARSLGAAALPALRVDPYHRTVAARRPEWAPLLAPYTRALLERRECLVHGDLSPKNVLTGVPWIIDHEVAHHGDSAFDPAFLLHHLLLKSLHVPGLDEAAEACAEAFLAGYAEERKERVDGRHVAGHTGALLLARTDGLSRAEYLTPAGRAAARALGVALLEQPPATAAGMWRVLRALGGASGRAYDKQDHPRSEGGTTG